MLIAHLPFNSLITHRATAANIITVVKAITLKFLYEILNVVVVFLYKTAWEMP